MILLFKTKFDRTPTKGVEFKIPSTVQQSDKDASDINLIIKRYCECGVCPTCSAKEPISEELAMLSGEDFNSMMQKMAQVNNQFNELPSDVRKKFGNNPANMLEFIQDPNNRKEAEKLGLIERRDFGISGNATIDTSVPQADVLAGSQPVQTGEKVVEVNNDNPTA